MKNSEKSSPIGPNKTGMQMSPIMSKEMLNKPRGMAKERSTGRKAGAELAIDMEEMEISYIQSVGPIGSVPLPGTLKGIIKVGTEKLTKDNIEVFIDKLGERLAFERTGVRLYDAFIRKCQAGQREQGERRERGEKNEMEKSAEELSLTIPTERFIQFRNEELDHFKLIQSCMEEMGADPSSQTPYADTNAVMSSGLLQVLTDPRTSLSQCTQAILMAELSDNNGWEMLIKMADMIGKEKLVENFRLAYHQESVHLAEVKNFVEKLIMADLM